MLIESKSSSKRRATARRMHFFVVCFRVHGFTAPTRRHARQRGGWGSPGPVRNNTRARQLDKTPRNHPTRLASRSGTPRRTRGGRALASRAAGPPRRRRRALSGDRSGVPSCRDCRAVARDGRGEWAGECGDRTEKDNKVNSHKSQKTKPQNHRKNISCIYRACFITHLPRPRAGPLRDTRPHNAQPGTVYYKESREAPMPPDTLRKTSDRPFLLPHHIHIQLSR